MDSIFDDRTTNLLSIPCIFFFFLFFEVLSRVSSCGVEKTGLLVFKFGTFFSLFLLNDGAASMAVKWLIVGWHCIDR